ncbi:MAG: class I SAM-dependent methyltransferase [Solirubrobacteraceae bacterium]
MLELACGTGRWTRELVEYATEPTAVDASEEMIALNRVRVARPDGVYVHADEFAWSPAERYDVVFFSARLSHVPPQRFDEFCALVAGCFERGLPRVRDRRAAGGHGARATDPGCCCARGRALADDG